MPKKDVELQRKEEPQKEDRFKNILESSTIGNLTVALDLLDAMIEVVPRGENIEFLERDRKRSEAELERRKEQGKR